VKQNQRFSRPAATIKKQMKVLSSADVPLEQVQCPVLAMSGEHDVVVPPKNSEHLLSALTGSPRKELVIVPGQGHCCWGICPPRRQLNFSIRDSPPATHSVAKIITRFLAGESGLTSKL